MKKSEVDIIRTLSSGGEVSGGRLNGEFLRHLQEEQLVFCTSHGSRVSFRAVSPGRVASVFRNELAAAALSCLDSVSRAEQVASCGDSKAFPVRSCPGFPVNSYEPISATLSGRDIGIFPAEGSFLFISDWRHFRIPSDIVVVGVENMENFRLVGKLKNLFGRYCAPVLFVSRYPQSGDLVKWLCDIPNKYLHFGDLDLAGVHIFLTEFHVFIGDRAEFFIPPDADVRLAKGSRKRYDDQLPRFGRMTVSDSRVQYLVDLIHKHHRGYDQEGYLG